MLCIIETRPVFGYGLSNKEIQDKTTKRLINLRPVNYSKGIVYTMDGKTGYLGSSSFTENSSYGRVKTETRIYPINPNQKLFSTTVNNSFTVGLTIKGKIDLSKR